MKNDYTPPPQNLNGIKRTRGVYEKPKNLKGTAMRLWAITAGQRRGFLLILLLSLLSSFAAILSPLLTGRIITSISSGHFMLSLVIALSSVYLSDYVFKSVQQRMLAVVGQRIINHIRNVLFEKLLRLPLSFFDSHQHGELMSRLTNDVDSISTTISNSLSLLLSYSFSIAGVLISMLALSPLLTVTMIIPVVLLLALTKIVTKRTRAYFSKRQAALGTLNAHVEESISNIPVVKVFSKEDEMQSSFDEKSHAYREISTKAMIWSGILMPMMEVINNLSYLLIAVISAVLYINGYITSIGLITSFLLYVKQFTRPFVEIANVYNSFLSAIAGAERVFQILDEDDESDCGKEECRPKGDIEFRNVSFSYDGKKQILKDINLDIKAGTKVAIVGETGSGKTTLVNLLTRFYEVSDGEILIDGHDIKSYTLSSLRHSFSVVLQDTPLFSASIYSNIAYGKSGTALDDVRMAAEEAGADSFIERLSAGYATELQNLGSELSQGERQLIAISRAFLTKAPLMILDEATSSVDTVTEARIRQSVFKLSKGRTSFIIAHRLSTIIDSDLILVMDQGRIAEMGNHKTLMDKRGLYYQLSNSQLNIPR